jgi:CRISPR type IV-associated protein Csf3
MHAANPDNPAGGQCGRVDVVFSTPLVVPERPIHLDSIIAALMVEDACAKNEDDPLQAQNRLPFDRHTQGGEWVWKASCFIGQVACEFDVQAMTRRTNLCDMENDRHDIISNFRIAEVTMGTGQLKQYDMRFAVQFYHSLSAWFVGDIHQVRAILTNLRHIGKIRRNGFGKISRINVVEDPHAEDNWRQRTLPAAMKEITSADHKLAYCTVRPPYWDRTMVTKAYQFCERRSARRNGIPARMA